MKTTDAREAAAAAISQLISLLESHPAPATAALIEECEALSRAVASFHMEGIRFRMFNVDRQVSRGGEAIPPGAPALLEEARRHLEAAGFHTRSHQAPS
jgi:hypothetical protein